MASRKLWVISALSLMLAAPVVAHADTYAPGPNNQTFATGQGGWSASSSNEGLCVPQLLCPGVTNAFVGSGGADGGGDGYIRTEFTSLLETLAGTSTGVWQSPAFTYTGNAGSVPAALALDLSIRPQISALLGLTLVNDSSYRVDLVDQSNSSVVSAIPQTLLVNDAGWTAVPTASINPTLLTLGHSYKTRITTSYHAVATVVASGEVGFDNVRLTSSGIAGGGGGGGGGIDTPGELSQLVIKVGLPDSGRLVGNKLKLKIKCPAQASPHSCGYSLRGLAKGPKSQVATARKVALINHGVVRLVSIKVKPRFLKQYKKADKVFIRARVRVSGIRVTVVKQIRLTH